MELSADRPSGFGPAPIPSSSVDRFAQREELDGDDFEKFRRMIRSMDTVFLERARATRDQGTPASSQPGKQAFPTTVSTVPMSKGLFKKLFLKKE